jgi:hypothetical protein
LQIYYLDYNVRVKNKLMNKMKLIGMIRYCSGELYLLGCVLPMDCVSMSGTPRKILGVDLSDAYQEDQRIERELFH